MWTAVILLVLHSHTFMMAQTDKHGKPTPVHNKSIPAFNMELELMHSTKGKQLVPTDNSEQLASFHVGVPLVERGFNRGHAVSGVQAGPSSRDSPNSERPEQWGRCNTCNSRVHDLSEWDDIPTCSVCRKKVNDRDPLLLRPMDVELQTQASKLPRRGKRTRQADAAGRTPVRALCATFVLIMNVFHALPGKILGFSLSSSDSFLIWHGMFT
jgi:hypothetical protein